MLQVGNRKFLFETLGMGSHDKWRPLMFIQQSATMISVPKAGERTIKIVPLKEGKELFKLSRVILRPVN